MTACAPTHLQAVVMRFEVISLKGSTYPKVEVWCSKVHDMGGRTGPADPVTTGPMFALKG